MKPQVTVHPTIAVPWIEYAIAILTVLIFGGWSGVVIGWLLSVGVIFFTVPSQNEIAAWRHHRLSFATIRAGLNLGLCLLGATLLQALLAPALGLDRVSWSQALIYGLTALVITLVIRTGIGLIYSLSHRHRRRVSWGFLTASLVLFPFIDQLAQTQWIATTIQVLIFIMLALGLNIVVGFAGLLDLGYAAFFAIGAYTTGLLSSPQLGIEWPFWPVLLVAAMVAALAGMMLGAPTLRLRGDYLAIVTLGFGEIVPVVFRNLTELRIQEPISSAYATLTHRPEAAICLLGCDHPLNLTGGEAGINPIGRPSLPGIGTFAVGDYLPWYYLILGLVVLAYFFIGRLQDSRLGRAWTAIREDELAASSMGVPLVPTKLLAFAMGASFSGFAGCFYAAYISAIFPSVFDFSVSVIILCMVILGGLGNMRGVILGSILIMAADRLYLPQLAQVLKSFLTTSVLPNVANPQLQDFIQTSLDPLQMRLFLFGFTLVIMMNVRPEGLVPDRLHQEELHDEAPSSSNRSQPDPALISQEDP